MPDDTAPMPAPHTPDNPDAGRDPALSDQPSHKAESPSPGSSVSPLPASANEFTWRPVFDPSDILDSRLPASDTPYPTPEDFEHTEADAPGEAPVAASRPTPADPWRHRRAEPRMFAFLWTLYLLAAVVGSLMWIAKSSVLSSSAYGPAARTMLLVILIGATVLWPMVRLSQLRPAGSLVAAGLLDLVVVAFPLQLISWPLVFLAGWPLDSVAAVSLLLIVWPGFVGSVVALTQSISRRAGSFSVDRTVALFTMILLVVLTMGGPISLALRDPSSWETRGVAWTFSPLTHMFRLTGSGLRGSMTPIAGIDFFVLGGIGVVALVVWFSAATLDRSGRRSNDRLD